MLETLMEHVKGDSILNKDSYLNMTWLDYVLKSGLTIEEFALNIVRENRISTLKNLFGMGESLHKIKIMHTAAEANSVDVLDYMLKIKGCEVKEKYLGETILHRAIIKNSLLTVEYLLQNFPNLLNIKNDQDETPLHYVANIGNLTIVDRLMKRGADVNAGCEGLDTPLHLAVRGNHVKVLQVLSTYKPDTNIRDVDGNKPIIFAMKNPDMLSILKDAKLTVRDNFYN